MTIMTYAQAEHELTRVAARFEDWRHRRTTSSTPIPPSLWEQAVSLTMVLSISRVAQSIGVSWATLKKALYSPILCPCYGGTLHHSGLCGSAWHPCMAASAFGDRDRTLPS